MQVPVRACDVGGWTDTWFAREGRVCSLALGPGVSVDARRADGPTTSIEVVATGERFPVEEAPAHHRLLVEAVAEASPQGAPLDLRIGANVPPGASLGTSASVSVGIISAVDAVLRGAIRAADDLAAAAHRVEGERLGRQSGVQDQLAAAHGGVNRIDVRYPFATVHPLALDPAVLDALDRQLLHVAYGGPHDSSAVHEQVIAALTGEGATRLAHLRALAADAEAALLAGDLPAWGAVLREATEAQAALHPDLVSGDARALIEAARRSGALGWKVNGAAGAGGSLSVLLPTEEGRRRLADVAGRLGQQPLELRLEPRGAHVVEG